jgi:hypothetical protein
VNYRPKRYCSPHPKYYWITDTQSEAVASMFLFYIFFHSCI